MTSAKKGIKDSHIRISREAAVSVHDGGVVILDNRKGRMYSSGPARIATVSYVWKGSLDEKFIREVESFCGIEGAHISTHVTPVIGRTQAGISMPESFAPMRASVAEVANRLGAKVVLTGRTGDLVMGNWFDDSLQVAAHMRRLRLGRACRDGLAWSKVLGLPIYAILWRALRAALPPALSPAAAYAKPDGSYAPMKNETSLLPAFCERAGISGESEVFSTAWMQARPERRKYFRSLSMLLELRSLKAPEPLQHLDYTHPFAHRPLLEFLMTVPADVLCGPGEPRRLMRRTLSDLWPPDLRKRRSKGLFGAPWHEALQPLVRDLLQSRQFQVVERGYVDRASLVSRLEGLRAGLDSNATQLQQIVLLEFWLRNRWPARTAGSCLQAA